MEGAVCGGGGGRKKDEVSPCGAMKLPGFRFHPTDEELVSFYLHTRLHGKNGRTLLTVQCLIPDLDIYKYDPWDLPKLARLGESHSGCYFFSPRDRKYRNSTRPNRVTLSGFWKATGTDRPVHSGGSPSECVGLKKSLVFYLGRASKNNKTDWMMHEFRLPNQPEYGEKDTCWALCKIFKRKSSSSQYMSETQAFVAEDLPSTAETNLDKFEALDSFGGEDCSEEDSKSENTTHTSLAPGHVPSSVDIMRSSCTSQDELTMDRLVKSSESTKNVALFSRQREPLTVRVSKSSNVWAEELLSSWFSPAIMKPFDIFRTGGQTCVGDTSLLLTDQSLQESLQAFTPDYLGNLFCSPQWNPPLPLWDQPTYFQDSTFNTPS